MKHKRNWIIGIALSATAGFVALQSVNAPTQNGETTKPVNASCAYIWATQDAPELTETLDTSIKSLNSQASATAYFYGEDCVYANGTSTFAVMETDFTVRLPVDDLTDEETFGDWVAQVLDAALQLPEEEIQGKYGFVEFWFEQSEAKHITFRVPIPQYQTEAQGKTGAELFRMYYALP